MSPAYKRAQPRNSWLSGRASILLNINKFSVHTRQTLLTLCYVFWECCVVRCNNKISVHDLLLYKYINIYINIFITYMVVCAPVLCSLLNRSPSQIPMVHVMCVVTYNNVKKSNCINIEVRQGNIELCELCGGWGVWFYQTKIIRYHPSDRYYAVFLYVIIHARQSYCGIVRLDSNLFRYCNMLRWLR